ncbi:MAG: adenylosuccinate synthase [Deltaproteobacteria bacterium]|nr:adenylosuccinate synthase [Deltaproteobacteria bacterium]
MAAVVVVGAQWGDEGKGKIVDHLARSADVVVRYAGGANAGHTLVVDGNKIVVRLVPSGILWPEKLCVLAQGMVIDPTLLVKEIEELESQGHQIDGRLFVSDRAHAILPYHALADGLRENLAAPGRAIGTTRRGIGPAYEDKAARRGLLLGDLRDPDRAAANIRAALDAWRPLFDANRIAVPSVESIVAELAKAAARIVPLLADTSALVHSRLRARQRVLFEGAQGTLLDIDHGTYPFVTSSSTIAAGACTGTGIGPRAITRVLGITKAYATRVGGGPFPTELNDSVGDHLKKVGAEFGSVTGRARRTGWLDVAALRYAARVNGFDAMAMTKLDVLSGLDPIRVCVAYDTPRGRTQDLPVDLIDVPGALTPVYENLAGWSEPIGSVSRVDALPDATRRYIEFVEHAVGVRCDILSVGPSRDATLVVNDSFA